MLSGQGDKSSIPSAGGTLDFLSSTTYVPGHLSHVLAGEGYRTGAWWAMSRPRVGEATQTTNSACA